MAVRVVEIDPAAAVTVVDFARPLAARGGIVPDAARTDARQRRIELRFADEEGVMLRPEILAIGEIERHAVGGADRCEMAPFRTGLQVQDVGEEFGGCPSVPRRDDRVIELDSHLRLLSVPPRSRTAPQPRSVVLPSMIARMQP